MTVGSPLIASWNERGIPWKFESHPVVIARQRAITLAPYGQPGWEVRYPDRRWEHEEGFIRYISVGGDSPLVGIRIKTANLDFQYDVTTIALNAVGLTVPDGTAWNNIWAAPVIIPPYVNVPIGYGFIVNQEAEWRKWMELWLVNNDPTAPHTIFVFYMTAHVTEGKATLIIPEALPLLNLRNIIQYVKLFNGEVKNVKTHSIEAEFWEHNAVPFERLMKNMGVKM